MNIKRELPNVNALIDVMKRTNPVLFQTMLQRMAWIENSTNYQSKFLIDSKIISTVFETIAVVETVADRVENVKFTADTSTVFFNNLNTGVYDARIISRPSVTEQVRSLIDCSELLVERKTLNWVDDVFNVQLGENRLTFAEFYGSVEARNFFRLFTREKPDIYSGYFFAYQLPKNYEGKTFLSTVNRTGPWNHKQFWVESLAKNNVSETELEWNDFGEVIHVATTDQVMAREILTPDFMLDLHAWWKNDKSNIRVSLIGDRMCVLFPALPLKPNLGQQELIERVLDPVLHLLHLTEDVCSRFR